MTTEKGTDVIGSEGLATSLAALASQVSSIEKATNLQIESVRREATMEHAALRSHIDESIEALRREIVMATSTLAQQVAEKEQGIRRETMMATNTIKDEVAAAIDAARAAGTAAIEMSRSEREMGIERIDHLIASESSRMMAVMDERMGRVIEVEKVRNDAHMAVHDQIDESTRIALVTLNGRLDGFPREYASVSALHEVKDSLSKLAEDIRLRAETAAAAQSSINVSLERRLVEGLQSMIDTARREVRPVQDANAGQRAIWAAIGGVGLILGIIIAMIGLASRFMGGGG